MNKRGQLYLLAAILLALAIYGVIKVQNRIEITQDPDFSFFIENFKGERTQVINLGYVSGQEKIGDMSALFAEFGWNTGIILIKPSGGGYDIYNFRNDDITVCSRDDCDIETGALSTVGELRFDFGGDRTVKITDSTGQDVLENLATTPKHVDSIFTLTIEGNIFNFNDPGYKTIVFKDIDENFKKVEIV